MEKKTFPSELQDRFLVRLPSGMREQIAEAARENNRSMNAEIVLRLEKSFQDKPLSVEDAIEKFNQATAQLKDLFAHAVIYDSDDEVSGVVFTGISDGIEPTQVHRAPKKRRPG